jgi:hypothetical protein
VAVLDERGAVTSASWTVDHAHRGAIRLPAHRFDSREQCWKVRVNTVGRADGRTAPGGRAKAAALRADQGGRDRTQPLALIKTNFALPT